MQLAEAILEERGVLRVHGLTKVFGCRRVQPPAYCGAAASWSPQGEDMFMLTMLPTRTDYRIYMK